MSRNGRSEGPRSVVVSARLDGRPDGAKIVTSAFVALVEQRTTVETIDRSNEDGGMLKRLRTRLRTETRVAAALVRGARSDSGVVLYRELSCVNGMGFDVLVAAIAAVLGVPMYTHLHSWSSARNPVRSTRLVFRLHRTASLIVLSHRMAETVIDSFGIDASRVLVGANRGVIAVPDARKQESGVAEEVEHSLQVCMLSNPIPGKGTDSFVNLAQMGPRHWTYSLAGPIGDAAAKSLVDRFSQLESATYCGPLYGGYKEAFFNRCDVFVFPSRYSHEAWPLVVEEALAHGCYVIATDVGLLREQLDDSLMGATVSASDVAPAVLVEAVNSAIDAGLLSSDSRRERASRWSETAAVAQGNWLAIADSVAGLPRDS